MLNLVRELQNSSQLLEGKLLYGTVVDNKDPEEVDRCRIRVRDRHKNYKDEEIPWAIRIDGKGGSGPGMREIYPPPLGARVLLTYLDKTMYFPAYYGGVYDTTTKLDEFSDFYPEVYGGIDAAGNLHKWVTKEKEEQITYHLKKGVKLYIDKDGNIEIRGPKDITISAKEKINLMATNIYLLGDVGVSKTLKATTDVIGGNVSLKGHTHPQPPDLGGDPEQDTNAPHAAADSHVEHKDPLDITERKRPDLKFEANKME